MMHSASEPDADLPPPAAIPHVDGWTWKVAQAHLTVAYEHGGVARLAEATVRELEAEDELERRMREHAVSVRAPTWTYPAHTPISWIMIISLLVGLHEAVS